VRKVGNTSMEWSRALLDVLVPYDIDVAQVTAAIDEEAQRLAAEDRWREKILEPPQVWGVQTMGAEGLTIRLVVKTLPRQQDDVERELLTRISARLRRDGVRSPGQTMVITAGALDQGAPAPPPATE
jgi:small conductance mechanosensitive channel